MATRQQIVLAFIPQQTTQEGGSHGRAWRNVGTGLGELLQKRRLHRIDDLLPPDRLVIQLTHMMTIHDAPTPVETTPKAQSTKNTPIGSRSARRGSQQQKGHVVAFEHQRPAHRVSPTHQQCKHHNTDKQDNARKRKLMLELRTGWMSDVQRDHCRGPSTPSLPHAPNPRC